MFGDQFKDGVIRFGFECFEQGGVSAMYQAAHCTCAAHYPLKSVERNFYVTDLILFRLRQVAGLDVDLDGRQDQCR